MKRILSVAVLLMLTLTLCACGKGSKTPSDSNNGQSTSSKSESTFEMGTVTGNQYSNKFLGIGCTLDSDWTFSTDEQIRETNSISTDLLDEEMQSQLENASIVYDMMATCSNGDSININIENLGISGALATAETYINSQTDSLKTALEQIGLSDVVIDNKTFDFAGSSEKGIYVSGTINGVKLEEAIIVLKRGTRFANVTVTTINGSINDIIAQFRAL
ncbi:MAG: hypothetical protein PUB05_01920 [Firmicutes bacterium]|nr:hypothetical protein [Bacillota bacterium]